MGVELREGVVELRLWVTCLLGRALDVTRVEPGSLEALERLYLEVKVAAETVAGDVAGQDRIGAGVVVNIEHVDRAFDTCTHGIMLPRG